MKGKDTLIAFLLELDPRGKEEILDRLMEDLHRHDHLRIMAKEAEMMNAGDWNALKDHINSQGKPEKINFNPCEDCTGDHKCGAHCDDKKI